MEKRENPKKKGKTHNPFTPPFSFSTNFFYFDRIDPFLYFLICGKAFLTKFSLFIDFIYHFLLFYLILTLAGNEIHLYVMSATNLLILFCSE